MAGSLKPASSYGVLRNWFRFDITETGTERSFETIRNKRICFGSFGINRNSNVSILSVVSVQPKKNQKTEGRGKGGGGREKGGRLEEEGRGKGTGREREGKGKVKGR
jgi:hypothetical protein